MRCAPCHYRLDEQGPRWGCARSAALLNLAASFNECVAALLSYLFKGLSSKHPVDIASKKQGQHSKSDARLWEIHHTIDSATVTCGLRVLLNQRSFRKQPILVNLPVQQIQHDHVEHEWESSMNNSVSPPIQPQPSGRSFVLSVRATICSRAISAGSAQGAPAFLPVYDSVYCAGIHIILACANAALRPARKG